MIMIMTMTMMTMHEIMTRREWDLKSLFPNSKTRMGTSGGERAFTQALGRGNDLFIIASLSYVFEEVDQVLSFYTTGQLLTN